MNLTFHIRIEQSLAVIVLSGKILSEDDYDELERDVFDLLNQNYSKLIFDLNNLSHTNSSGISFFLRTLTKARILEGDLVLVGLNGNVEMIFNIAKLNEVYTICADENAATEYFKAI